ncbi:Sodium-coupled neutral amino acid transporter 4 [Acipenser ruthenus]|uniref:Sodium-coupled neutral amino acid transporter 4 n=1 Tax=Acipenser ruthenus TaxID=7906 RepID=A0A444UJT9_ACIRT|nr:Sodium-coupled neutral amino acid transporter 4 [Acipenser ruthenus]
MELKKVNTDPDDESNSGDSMDGCFNEPIDSEKATISSQFADEDDAESQKFLTNGGLGRKKYEEYQEECHPGTTSFGMSVFNLSNAIMGSGILGLSYAMANTGIVLFVILLLGVAILSLYSVHLLLLTSKEGGSLIYEKLGEKAFGWPGKLAAFLSITMQNIGAMSSYLFIVKYELPEVIRAFMGLEENTGEWYLNGNYLVVIVSLAIILPLSMLKNLGYLGYTSGFSLTCMVFFLGVVRSSITTLLFAGREFSWIRHFLIAVVLLVFNNLLVIFVPTIRDIFGFIGSSAATMLIFILPAAFYIRLVKSIPLKSPQKIGCKCETVKLCPLVVSAAGIGKKRSFRQNHMDCVAKAVLKTSQ